MESFKEESARKSEYAKVVRRCAYVGVNYMSGDPSHPCPSQLQGLGRRRADGCFYKCMEGRGSASTFVIPYIRGGVLFSSPPASSRSPPPPSPRPFLLSTKSSISSVIHLPFSSQVIHPPSLSSSTSSVSHPASKSSTFHLDPKPSISQVIRFLSQSCPIQFLNIPSPKLSISKAPKSIQSFCQPPPLPPSPFYHHHHHHHHSRVLGYPSSVPQRRGMRGTFGTSEGLR